MNDDASNAQVPDAGVPTGGHSANALVQALRPAASRFSPQQWELLLQALPANADHLWRRRCSLIGERAVDDYVALQWMRWNGGSLELTVTGKNLCQLLAAGSR